MEGWPSRGSALGCVEGSLRSAADEDSPLKDALGCWAQRRESLPTKLHFMNSMGRDGQVHIQSKRSMLCILVQRPLRSVLTPFLTPQVKSPRKVPLGREAEPGVLGFPEDSLHVLGQLPVPGPQFLFLKDKGSTLEGF